MEWTPSLMRRSALGGPVEDPDTVSENAAVNAQHFDEREWKPRLFPREEPHRIGKPVELRARQDVGLKERHTTTVLLRPRARRVAEPIKERQECTDSREIDDGGGDELLTSRGQRVYYRGSLVSVSTGIISEGSRGKRRRSRMEGGTPRAEEDGQWKRPCSGSADGRVPEVYRVDDGDTSVCDSVAAMSDEGSPGIATVMSSLGDDDKVDTAPTATDGRRSSPGGRGFDPSQVKLDGECLAITRWDEMHGQVIGLSWQERSSYAHGRYPRGPLRGGTAVLLSSAVYRGEETRLFIVDVKGTKYNVLMGIGFATEPLASRRLPTGGGSHGVLEGREWIMVTVTVDGHVSVASHQCANSYLGRIKHCSARCAAGDALLLRYLPGRVQLARRDGPVWVDVSTSCTHSRLVPVVKLCGAVTQVDVLPPAPFIPEEPVEFPPAASPPDSRYLHYSWPR